MGQTHAALGGSIIGFGNIPQLRCKYTDPESPVCHLDSKCFVDDLFRLRGVMLGPLQ